VIKNFCHEGVETPYKRLTLEPAAAGTLVGFTDTWSFWDHKRVCLARVEAWLNRHVTVFAG